MRRFIVLCLILLFPLNVLALSMSVASFQHADPIESTPVVAPVMDDAFFSSLFDTASSGDLDSDEPPGVADLHDQVNEEDKLQLVLLPDWTRAGVVPLRHAQSASPPLKPPPIL